MLDRLFGSTTKASIENWDPQLPLPFEFIEIFREVRRQQSFTVPESEAELRFLFSDLNPFFRAGGQAWVKTHVEGARLAGFFRPGLKIDDEPCAFFGYWETTAQIRGNRELFAAFEAWAKSKGAKTVYGPINFSTIGMYRLRTDSLGGSQWPGEPWNPSYYPEVLSLMGYNRKENYASYVMTDIETVQNWERDLGDEFLKQALEGYEIAPLSREIWTDRRAELKDLSNQIYSQNFAFEPMDQNTFDLFYGPSLFDRICQKTSLCLIHRESDRLAGFCLNLAFTNPEDGGRELLVKTAGVASEDRKQGLTFLAMVAAVVSQAQDYARIAVCLMKDGNFPTLLVKSLPHETRTYGLYAKKL